jgi:hypothetical protein
MWRRGGQAVRTWIFHGFPVERLLGAFCGINITLARRATRSLKRRREQLTLYQVFSSEIVGVVSIGSLDHQDAGIGT